LNSFNALNASANYADFGTPVTSRYTGDFMKASLVKKDNTWWTLKL